MGYPPMALTFIFESSLDWMLLVLNELLYKMKAVKFATIPSVVAMDWKILLL